MSKKIVFTNNYDELYFKSLNKARYSKEYLQNQMQIDCIAKLLIQYSNVPPRLIDWLIESVQENVAIEYEFAKNIKS